jgi:hypothetical protein
MDCPRYVAYTVDEVIDSGDYLDDLITVLLAAIGDGEREDITIWDGDTLVAVILDRQVIRFADGPTLLRFPTIDDDRREA